MKKIFLSALISVVTASFVSAVPVKDDPNKLPDHKLAQYFNKRRNLDRYLQTGQYGPAITAGKEILKDFVKEDAYAAFCIAAAYGSILPDPESGQDTVGEAVEYLDHAVEWGFRNVEILESSQNFEFCRDNKEFKSMITYLKKVNAQEIAVLKKVFPRRIKKQIDNATPVELELPKQTIDGKPLKAEIYKGKCVFVPVLRPQHKGVALELDGLKASMQTAKEKDVVVIGAIYNYYASERLKKQALKFVKDNKLTFPVVMVERDFAKKYNILNLPAHLLADTKGKVIYVRSGAQEKWRLEALLEILAEVGK